MLAAASPVLMPSRAGWSCDDPIISPKTPVNSAVVTIACM
jgi:hypothetical protein